MRTKLENEKATLCASPAYQAVWRKRNRAALELPVDASSQSHAIVEQTVQGGVPWSHIASRIFFPRVRTPCGHGAQVIIEGREIQSGILILRAEERHTAILIGAALPLEEVGVLKSQNTP